MIGAGVFAGALVLASLIGFLLGAALRAGTCRSCIALAERVGELRVRLSKLAGERFVADATRPDLGEVFREAQVVENRLRSDRDAARAALSAHQRILRDVNRALEGEPIQAPASHVAAKVADLRLRFFDAKRDAEGHFADVKSARDELDKAQKDLEVVKSDRDAVLRREAQLTHRLGQVDLVARTFFHADGVRELCPTVEEVVERRKAAAREIVALRGKLEAERAKPCHACGALGAVLPGTSQAIAAAEKRAEVALAEVAFGPATTLRQLEDGPLAKDLSCPISPEAGYVANCSDVLGWPDARKSGEPRCSLSEKCQKDLDDARARAARAG